MTGYEDGRRVEWAVVQRIFAKVDIGDCWEWTGYRNPLGYGQLRFEGRTTLAHRAVWTMLVGPIQPGLELDHLCRMPQCVNPDHLEPVTHRENVRRGVTGIITARRLHAITQCPQWHDYDDENTSHTAVGGRQCRACARISSAARRASDPERTHALDRARYADNPEIYRDRSRAVRARQVAS